MRRAAKVTYAAPVRAKVVPVFHAHGCIDCGGRYMDACTDSGVNGRCLTCRTGIESRLDLGRLPMSCCRTKSTLVDSSDVLTRYALAGPGPWFQCRICARTHPFDPYDPPKETL